MRIFSLEGQPSEALSRALAKFESQFSYPMGQADRFAVFHGDDYARFFRAMGRAQCFLAEMGGEIVGSFAVVVRRIGLPDGTESEVGYLGDVKIAPRARGGSTLFRLAAAATAWVPRSVDAYYGVVMDGTEATPDEYSGRAGLPAFSAVGKVMITRLLTSSMTGRNDPAISESEFPAVTACFRELSAGRYSTPCTAPSERSLTAPISLMARNRSACGCLEDTRRAKRLVLQDGTELLSMHLSSFAYRDVRSGGSLIREALTRASSLGFPAVLVAIAAADADQMFAELTEYSATLAPATIYGHGLAPNVDWNLNTAEI